MHTAVARILCVALLAISALVPTATPTAAAPAAVVAFDPVAAAYRHLDQSVDQHATSGPRLPSSFNRTGPLHTYDTAHTYDVSLAMMAYLARGTAADIARARALGDALVRLQAADPARDGRLRDGYDPSPLFLANGLPNIDSAGSATGNLAWAGTALVKLYTVTRDARYVTAANRLAAFLYRSRSWNSLGGYTGGLSSSGARITWKSTEHNIDVAAFFTQLGAVTRNPTWIGQGAHAKGFVRAMWDARNQRFVVGTYADGRTRNTGDNPVEDVQAWGTLLLAGERTYLPALSWVRRTLQVTDPRQAVTGVKFSAGPDATRTVWLEGTAHMMLALKREGTTSARQTAATYQAGLLSMQRRGPNNNGLGLVAATHTGTAGGDDALSPSTHVGATAWYVLALRNVNPFVAGVRG